MQEFTAAMRQLPHKHKIVIAGNHELSFDPEEMTVHSRSYFGTSIESELQKYKISDIRDLLHGLIYLEDSSIEVRFFVADSIISLILTALWLQILRLAMAAGIRRLGVQRGAGR